MPQSLLMGSTSSVAMRQWQRPGARVTVAASGARDATNYDYVCTGSADDVIINTAVTAASGGKVLLSEGTFVLTNPINITVAGTTLCGQGPGTTVLRQDTYGQPCVEVRGADDVTVESLKCLNTQASATINGNYDGRPARDHAAGVYVATCNRCTVRGCRFDGLVEGVHLRGNTSSFALFDQHNRVFDCTFNNLDQGVLAEQQDGLECRGLTITNVAQTQGVDPHAVYLTGPTSATFSFSKNCIISDVTCNGNTYASALHIKYAHNTAVTNITCFNCERGVDGTECHQSVFTNITVTSMAPTSGHIGGSDSQQQGIGFSNANQIRVSNCLIDITSAGDGCRGLADRYDGTVDSQTGLQGCNDNIFSDVTVVATYTGANTVGGFHLEGATRCEVRDCKFINQGAGTTQPAVLIRQLGSPLTGSVDCSVMSPTVKGTTVVVKVNSSSDTNTRVLLNRDLLLDTPASPVTDSGTTTKVGYLNSGTDAYVGDSPPAHSMVEWNYDPIAAVNAAALVSGTLYVMRLVMGHGGTITNVCFNVNTLGSTLTAATTGSITGAANNGSGLVRLTITTHPFSTNDVVTVASVVGTTEANGQWVVTSIDANHIDLVGSTFANAYTSGGTATRSGNLCAIYDSSGSFIAATADQVSAWGSTGAKTMVLAATVTLKAGSVYYIAVLSVGTTPPQPARGGAGVATFGQSGAGLRFSVNGTSLTKLPNTITPSSNTSVNSFTVWCGLS